jgi:hypothetical protein
MDLLDFSHLSYAANSPFYSPRGASFTGELRERKRGREREFLALSIRVANSASWSPRAATAQVPCCGVAILFYPYVSSFASRKGRRALISTV